MAERRARDRRLDSFGPPPPTPVIGAVTSQRPPADYGDHGAPYSPHHWLDCPVHGVTAVSRDFPDDIVQRLIDLHATCPTTGDEEPMTLHLTDDRHPGTLHFAHLFDFDHLPAGPLRDTSAQCAQLAQSMVTALPDGPELTAGLRKLLEAKDAFVRAALAPSKVLGGNLQFHEVAIRTDGGGLPHTGIVSVDGEKLPDGPR